MITDLLKNQYVNFQNKNEKAKIVNLLSSALISEDFTEEERCWALWNISDNLAMLRNADDELTNHKLFEKQILEMNPKYLHWIVSDGTQQMTLIVGGYEQYWIDLYKYACLHTPITEENRRICFESHRATVAIPIIIEYKFDKNNSLYALGNMKMMLTQLKDDYNFKFYELTYYTQCIGANTLTDEFSKDIVNKSLDKFIDILKYLDYDSNEHVDDLFILGSWQQLNRRRSKYDQAKCAINNYIIQLVNARQYQMALECYNKIGKYNLSYGKYFDDKIELAKEKFISTK